MLVTVPVKLYGRSHPDPKTLQWWSTLICQGQGEGEGEGEGYYVKVFKSFKGSRVSGVKG